MAVANEAGKEYSAEHIAKQNQGYFKLEGMLGG